MELIISPGGDLLEKLVLAAHEVYCEAQKSKGYQYGPENDDILKTNNALKPFSELSDSQKEQNFGTVKDIPRKLKLAGYEIVPAGGIETPFCFPLDVLESLSRLEHDRWLKLKIDSGWCYAPVTDFARKHHNCILFWEKTSLEERIRFTHPFPPDTVGEDELPEAQKEKDREMVRGIPLILSKAGFTISATTSS